MKLILSQILDGGSFAIDGKHFVNCTFTNCTLKYSGGVVKFETTHLRQCRYVFFGRARATVQFLQNVEMMPFDPAQWAEKSGLQH